MVRVKKIVFWGTWAVISSSYSGQLLLALRRYSTDKQWWSVLIFNKKKKFATTPNSDSGRHAAHRGRSSLGNNAEIYQADQPICGKLEGCFWLAPSESRLT